MIHILAYGSLRPGHYNHDRFGEGTFKVIKKDIVINGYKMYDLGAYPCIVNTGKYEDTIICDILETSNESTAFMIDSMEIGAGYISEPLMVQQYNCKIYVMPINNLSHYKLPKHIESGDWNSYSKVILN